MELPALNTIRCLTDIAGKLDVFSRMLLFGHNDLPLGYSLRCFVRAFLRHELNSGLVCRRQRRGVVAVLQWTAPRAANTGPFG